MSLPSYRDVLREHFTLRRSKDSAYSMRAFARDLDLRPSHLSAIFIGQRGLSASTAESVASSLGLHERQRTSFIDSVIAYHSRSSSERDLARERLMKRAVKPIPKERYRIFERWFYPAVLQWLGVHGGHLSVGACARELGIREDDVRSAVSVLLQTGFLKQQGRSLKFENSHFAGSSPVPSQMMRDYHAQVLRLAADRVNSTPQTSRKNISTFLTFDSSRAEEVRAYLENVQQDFLTRFQSEEEGDSVFVLSLNAFRLDKVL